MIKVILDNVVIEPIVETVEGAIIRLDIEVPNKGIIVAVGEGTKDDPMPVKVGDKVIYPKGAGITLEYNDKQYLIMSHLNLLAIY